ncbi:hypothetical protein K439DRAFT_1610928 [Ramaria rubella]|nr:hypothetical protein K439DRAFT_1610928 [Ramaria rubella]
MSSFPAFAFDFRFHLDPKPAPAHAVPAPPQPLLPDDDDDADFAFSSYIAHDRGRPTPPTHAPAPPRILPPSSPPPLELASAYSGSGSSFSSAVTPSASNAFSGSWAAFPMPASYEELRYYPQADAKHDAFAAQRYAIPGEQVQAQLQYQQVQEQEQLHMEYAPQQQQQQQQQYIPQQPQPPQQQQHQYPTPPPPQHHSPHNNNPPPRSRIPSHPAHSRPDPRPRCRSTRNSTNHNHNRKPKPQRKRNSRPPNSASTPTPNHNPTPNPNPHAHTPPRTYPNPNPNHNPNPNPTQNSNTTSTHAPAPAPAPSCIRCTAASHPCTVEGRKPRTPSRREWLLAQIREKDAQIAGLLAGSAGAGAGVGAFGGAGVGAFGGAGVGAFGGAGVGAFGNGGAGAFGKGGKNWSGAGVGAAYAGTLVGRTSLVLAGSKLASEVGAGAGAGLSAADRAALVAAEKGVGGVVAVAVEVVAGGEGRGGGGGRGNGGGAGDESEDEDEESSVGSGSSGRRGGIGRWSACGGRELGLGRGWEACGCGWMGIRSVHRPTTMRNTHTRTHDASTSASNTAPLPPPAHIPLPPMHIHALPDRGAPMGLLARMSLEEDVPVPSPTPSSVHASASVDSSTGSGTGPRGSTKKKATKRARSEEEDEYGGDENRWWQRQLSPPRHTLLLLLLLLLHHPPPSEWGIANPAYFQPGPTSNLALRRVLNERETPPPIVASGLVSWGEAGELFRIFFEHVSPFVSVLDPVLHTTSSVYERCPFLFTVVCAISSRYLPSRPGLHKIAMHFAKTAAATAFVDGVKSVELAQAYLLMSVYGLPARRWEEDRSWFYGGLASRIATDLGLDRASTTKPLSERHARELLNRTRTWLNCFNVDRSSSTQWGKPTGLREDAAVRGAKQWYRASRYNHPHDVHLVAYTELLRIVSRFHESVYSDTSAGNGLNRKCDFRALTEATEAEIRGWHDEVAWSYANESDPNDPGCVVRTKGVPVFENYMRLVMYSFGFEAAWKRHGLEPGDMFFVKPLTRVSGLQCMQSATAVVRHLSDVYAPSGYLKYAPDCFFVMGGFCSAFLLKMLRPEFAALMDDEQRTRIVELVAHFVEVLASPAAAIDETHTPKLYAKFLHGQLRHLGAIGGDAGAASQAPASTSTPVPTAPASTPVAPTYASAPTSAPTTRAASPAFTAHVPSMPPAPTPLDLPLLAPPFSHSPGGHSATSSAGSSVPTPGPEHEHDGASQGWGETWTESSGGSGSATAAAAAGVHEDPMELCEDEFLATMQAISSEQWLNSVLMPGYRWPGEEPMQVCQEGLIFGGGMEAGIVN